MVRHPSSRTVLRGEVRLEALWRAWGHLRLDPGTGMSQWLRDHADHGIASCSTATARSRAAHRTMGHGSRLDPLPVEAPPEALFHSGIPDDHRLEGGLREREFLAATPLPITS